MCNMPLQGDDIYVLEVNPRASRTVPFVAKVDWVAGCFKIAARRDVGGKAVGIFYLS